jgi:ABC-2 type transport system ATP-binding protein
MKRRLTIARASQHNPKIIIMDEPTAGLDAMTRRKIWSLIRDIKQNGGTVFLTTHYIEEASYLSDRVGILDKGCLIVEETPKNLIEQYGQVTVDVHDKDGLGIEIFKSRKEAMKHVGGLKSDFSIRETNLEDIFIKLTGRKETLSVDT